MFRAPTLIRVLTVAAIAVGASAATFSATPAVAQSNNIVAGYAVHGYDPVAYFTVGKPTEGSDAFTAEYNGAKYRFASAANRDLFQADPAKYAPQYGGFCAFGAAMGRKFDGDPNAWHIADGKLYLNINQTVQQRWLGNVEGFVRGANNNWRIIAGVPDAELEKSRPAGVTLGAQ